MFSQQLMNWIEDGYSNALEFLRTRADGAFAERVRSSMEDCTPDEQTVMKYYYSAMPYSDLTDTDFELLKKYAQHTVFLRKEIPWCREIPEKTFLMDVAAYRINNEKIMDCRSLFFDELWDRVKGLSMKEAALEANYWCAEHASYHLADPRTASALTVYRSGFGRCGEESVFAVTVLRSIGIPARQVYTPLWAHCDDNHAWVEVWCDGEWYFLGACEPEEVLNKGWFTGPASRAMLLHAKYFTCLPLAEAEFTEGFVHYVNRISMYAHSVMLTVEVTDGQGRPLPEVTVHFELLNDSSYRGIAAKTTDGNGRVTIELGKGSVRIHAVKGAMWTEQTVLSTDGTVHLVLDHADEPDGVWREYRLHAPDFAVIHPGRVTAGEKQRNRERAAQAERMRLERIASYYDEARADAFPQLRQRLKDSAANFAEIMRFLERDDNPYRETMIRTLTPKDMYDLDADVLEEHLQAAMAFTGQYPDEIFERFLLSPRVEHEELTCYRSFLNDYFTEEQKAAFTEQPERIWEYIRSHIGYEESRDFEKLRISPKGALTLGLADPVSQKILFCAICRTLGIPARIKRMHFEAEYYRDGEFVPAERGSRANGAEDAALTLTFEPDTEWHYFRGWSLCSLQDGMFRPLGLFRTPIENGRMELHLPAGVYRCVVTVRLPGGDQMVRELTFALHDGEKKQIDLTKHHPQMRELLIDRQIPAAEVHTDEGTAPVESLAEGKRQMVLWLEPGKEPTQHVLNELLDNEAACRRLHDRIALLICDDSVSREPVLAKLLQRVPELTCHIPAEWELSVRIAQGLNLQADQYPLIYVKDERDHVIYADCGYNVGSVDLMLKLMEEI